MSNRFLRRVTGNPTLNIMVGLVFFATGLIEIWQSIEEEFALGAHHGAVLFGLWHAVRHLPELFEGAEYVQHTGEGD